MNKDLLKFIQHLSKEDKKTLSQKALKTTEECGELAKVVLPYDSAYATNHRFIEKERILEETVDTILCALSCAYHLNFNDDEIETMMFRKSEKWLQLQNNEKDLKYPIPFEIHVTVKPTKDSFGKIIKLDVDTFKDHCKIIGVKPILLDLHTKDNKIITDIQTSSKHFGTNASAYEESDRISDYFSLHYLIYDVVRVKIESIPNHPMAPKRIGDIMPKSCYFETHFPIIINPNDIEYLTNIVQEIQKCQGIYLHISKNVFKKHNDGKETIMITLRDDKTYLEAFNKAVDNILKILYSVTQLEIGKFHKEFSVYDTNISHDAHWLLI